MRPLDQLARMPFTRGNHVELLIDGEATFEAIFAGIESATKYVLVQFFVVKDDGLGRELKQRLMAKAREGVKIYFLYDEVGSKALPESYVEECRAAGIDMRPFHSTKGRGNRFQLNFRNHRKIVVIDGRVGFVGGHNVGDEYLGKDPEVGAWRDTHVRVEGPMATGLQFAFVEDWHWAADTLAPELEWMPVLSKAGDASGVVLATGPADEIETCGLFFSQAIHSARQRIWIASPYFVPDEAAVAALQLAALRGVDVRILLPKNPDHLLVYLASYSYRELARKTNVKILRYKEGFMHQKVLLVDDVAAAVGTANMDTRSFRLNFEVMAIVADHDFARQVEQMLLRDFGKSEEMAPDALERKPWYFRLGVRIARLLSPIL